MTDEVGNMILETMKRFQADMTKMRDDQKTMYAVQLAMQQTLTGHSTLLNQILEDVATVRARLDRIERRLDLVDAAQ